MKINSGCSAVPRTTFSTGCPSKRSGCTRRNRLRRADFRSLAAFVPPLSAAAAAAALLEKSLRVGTAGGVVATAAERKAVAADQRGSGGDAPAADAAAG